METIAESGGVIPHHHHPIAGSNYFPQKDTSSSYFFPNSANPQSMYRGYNQEDVRSMMYGQRKGGHERREGEERGGGRGSGMPMPSGNGERYYLPSSQASHVQQHSMSSYHHQQSPHRGMSQFLSPQRLDNDKANSAKISDGSMDSSSRLDQSLSPEKRSGKDNLSFDNNAMSSYYYNEKQGRQAGFMNDARHPGYDPSGYPDMRESVKDVYDSFNSDRNKEDGAKVEAVPVAYDDNEIRSQLSTNQHFREKLERSTSQDAVAARNMMNCHEYLSEGDHRPRAITMNSMYNRREGPPMQNSPYGNKNHELYNKMRDHFNQYGMNNPYYYRDKEKEGMPPMSPSAYMGKHQRRLSGGEARTPSRQDLMNRLMMSPQDKFHQPELRPPFPPMNQTQTQQHQSLLDQDRQSPIPGQHRSSLGSPRKSLESADDKLSPMKTPTSSEAMSTSQSPFGSGTRKSPVASSAEEAPAPSESGTTSPWASSNAGLGLASNVSDKQKTLAGDEAVKPKISENSSQDQDSSPKEESQEDMQSFDGNSNSRSKLGSSSSLSPKGDSPSASPTRKLSSDSPQDSLPDALPRELMPKKEILSDGEDDSYQGSGNFPPMTPPSPNSSSGMNYPPFHQPFFPSPERFPSQVPHPHPFGSARGMQDGPPGMPPAFPFNKDMPGRFPMPGIGRDMAMGPSGPPFMGQMPLPGQDKDVYFCHLCSYSGKSKDDFDNHMGIHFEYNCPHCDYTSRTEGRLKRHIKDFHTDENGRRSMPGRPKVFKCKQCSFSATEKDKFWEHARSHIKEDKLLQCPKCPFVTEYKHHLEYHLRNHFGSKPFKCNKCNYSCVNKSMLNSHMKSHTNVYQYRCSDCTYATKYCHSLKLHLRKYNHKPATVLNQDGSLPQGMDAEASGLSVNTKRGPPRGPRGPRKDKNDPYFNQMFSMPPLPMGMPPGMNPMLKGMVPFWPVMPPSGLPGHPGMMPGLPNMPQHMGLRGDGMDIRDRQGMDRNDPDMNGMMSGEDSPIKDDEDIMYLPCRLCDFIGDSTEALCLHLLQVHKDETGEMASMYGISETALAESMERAKKAKIDKAEHRMERRMSEISNGSESDLSHFRRRNTIAGLLSRDNPEFTRGNNDKPYWPSSYTHGEKVGVDGRIQDLCYVDEGNDDGENQNDTSGGMDILQQMTLKFGGALPTERSKSSDADLTKNEEEKGEGKHDDKSGGRKKLGHKESPLDLTKPKSVSPPMFSNPSSPRHLDEFNSEEDEMRSMWMESGRGSELDKVTENLARKRQISEMEDNLSGNNVMSEPSNIIPRKRSRKGKAYKLETLCMKLQERQSKSPVDSDDADSDCDFSIEKIQPLQQRQDDEIEKEKDDEIDAEIEGKRCEDSTNEGFKTNEEIEENDDIKMDESSNEKETSDKGMLKDEKEEMEENLETENKEEDDDDNGMNDETNIVTDDIVDEEKEKKDDENLENDDIKKEVTDELDDSFEKLQETLNSFNEKIDKERENEIQKEDGSLNEDNKSEELEKMETDVMMSFNDDVDDDDDDAKTEILGEDTDSKDIFDLSDKENSNDGFCSESTSAEKPQSDGVEIEDKVDMINTVIENRKKPLPPAVRRGTELAWKLLNDPVNPVTSIPIPVVSPPPPEWRSPPSTSALLPASSIATSPLANNMASPLKNGARMAPPFNQVLPPPPMKPHLPIPLPPTPMAFIPPTNRIVPDHIMPHPPPPMPINKPVPKDMYECTYCDLSFRDCVMYTVHMGYHSNRNPFKCNSCGIICRDKVEFFLHIARSPHS